MELTDFHPHRPQDVARPEQRHAAVARCQGRRADPQRRQSLLVLEAQHVPRVLGGTGQTDIGESGGTTLGGDFEDLAGDQDLRGLLSRKQAVADAAAGGEPGEGESGSDHGQHDEGVLNPRPWCPWTRGIQDAGQPVFHRTSA